MRHRPLAAVTIASSLALLVAGAWPSSAAGPAAGPTTGPAATAPAVPQSMTSPLGHTLSLRWHDEFDAVPDPDGTPYVDGSKWQTTFWQGSGERTLTGNVEAQYYMDRHYGGKGNLPVARRPDPFSFATPGVLTISATRVPKDLWANYGMGEQRPFCSGLLCSDHRFTFQYGYVQGRFQLPANRGAWPAFWLLPDDPKLGKDTDPKAHPWPPEVDVFEFFGHRPTTHTAGLIPAKGEPKPTFTFGYDPAKVDLTKDFHTWGFEWDADRCVWTLDGHVWARGTVPASLHRPFYILVNLAVGGHWYSEEMRNRKTPADPWQVDESTMPWQMRCDYVRVYQ